MAANKRTRIQIKDDRREIASLYLQGKTQQAIAERLNMTRQMVGYDLKAIQRRWWEDTSRNLDEDKARELAKLDELERTHWQAWEDSLEQVTTESSARTTSGRGNGHGSVTEQAAIRREGKQGNPAYLRGVMECIDRRCKILGLDAPAKQEISAPGGGPIQTDMKVILDALNDPEARDALDALSRRLESQPARWSGGQWVRTLHLDLISRKVSSLAEKPLRLIVSLPPRHGKSELLSHWTPVWFLANWSHKRVGLASYAAEPAEQWGRLARDSVVENESSLGIRVRDDLNRASQWQLSAGGGMMAAGVGGPFTGYGFDLLILDDPIKNRQEADSITMRNHLWEWWRSTARTRLEPGGSVIIVATRWHERYDASALAAARLDVGPQDWPGLYQQRPSRQGGSVFRDQWRVFEEKVELGEQVFQFWDTAFKTGQQNDYSVCPRRSPWLQAFREELATFPNGVHDDQVDAFVGCLTQFMGRAGGIGGFYV